jgi:hypothetical protein
MQIASDAVMPLNILTCISIQMKVILRIFSVIGRNCRDDGFGNSGMSSDQIVFCSRQHGDVTALPAEDSYTPGSVCAIIRLIACPLIATH